MDNNESSALQGKRCTKCDEYKTYDGFTWSATRLRYLSWCKQCSNIGRRERYAAKKYSESFEERRLEEIYGPPLEPVSKRCSTCGVEKFFEDFYKASPSKHLLGNVDTKCAACHRIDSKAKRADPALKSRYQEYDAQYCIKYKEVLIARRKSRYVQNKAKILQRNREWRQRNRTKMNAYERRYRIRNLTRVREYHRTYQKRWYASRKTLAVASNAEGTPIPKLNVRARVLNSLRKRISTFLGTGKGSSDLLGCSFEILFMWFTLNFILDRSVGMNWSNYGTVWEIDHVLPCSMFRMNRVAQMRKCFRWTNLAPVSIHHNRSKGARIFRNDIARQHSRLYVFHMIIKAWTVQIHLEGTPLNTLYNDVMSKIRGTAAPQ